MARSAASSKKRRYYRMSADIVRGNAPGMKMLNIDKLATNPYGTIDVEPPWRDGVSAAPDAGPWRFPDFCEPPRLLFDKKLGRPPRDLEDYNAYWLVSAALKDVLDALDPDAFDYRACETVLPTGEAGPKRWLCTVTRAFLGSVDVRRKDDLYADSTDKIETESRGRRRRALFPYRRSFRKGRLLRPGSTRRLQDRESDWIRIWR